MPKYSVVIPVFNSADIVGKTIDRVAGFFNDSGLEYEMILVNDGSADNSWDIIRRKAKENPHIIAINFLKNYGQHTANFCGFQESTGDYVITLDDDLQNPPEEIIHLIKKSKEGNYDLVIGRFEKKRHPFYRRLGSYLIGELNARIFDKPKDLVLTNFRMMRREVVDRICSYNTNFPYITGLTLWFSSNPANVLVRHEERRTGSSNYNLLRILKLVFLILFNYSSYPLRLLGGIGIVVSFLSLTLGMFYILKGISIGSSVPGWTTTVVLISFLNGFSILIVSMLGEYIVQLLRQGSFGQSFYIKEIIRPHE